MTPTPSESKMTAVEQAFEKWFESSRWRHDHDYYFGLEVWKLAHATGYAEGRQEERERCARIAASFNAVPKDSQLMAVAIAKTLREAPHE